MKRCILQTLIFVLTITNLPAQSEKSSSASQTAETDVITFQIGEAKISTLSEGKQRNKTANLIGLTPEIYRKYLPDSTYAGAINAFLLHLNDKNILIDAGFGKNLLKNIETLGLTAEKIDIILLTHMHGDHIGGLLKEGKPVFPNAELYVSKNEYDYWLNLPDEYKSAAFKTIRLYKDKMHLFSPSDTPEAAGELFSGIKAIAAYGHTPGHTVFLLESDGSRLLIWGDITHAIAVQMPHPEIAITYDINPEQAIETRKKLLEYVSKNKIPVAGMHIEFPSIGDVKSIDEESYEFKIFCTCHGF